MVFGLGKAAATLMITGLGPTVSGGRINGTILCTAPDGGTTASTLNLTISGQESTCVEYRHSTGSGDNKKTETRYAYGKRNLFSISVPLASFPGTQIPGGQHSYNFTAQIPSGLPPSMVVRGHGRSQCEIQYNIKVHLVRPGLLKSDVRMTAIFSLVGESHDVPPSPAMAGPATVAVNQCCCINRGFMTLGATTDRTMVHRGDTLSVAFCCKNDSTTNIDYTDVAMLEVISWTAGNHAAHAAKTIATNRFMGNPEDKLMKQHSSRDIAETTQGASKEIFENLNDSARNNTSKLIVQGQVVESYAGSIIQVQHTVTVRSKTACCITDPEVGIKVFIMANRTGEDEFIPTAVAIPNAMDIPMDSVVMGGVPANAEGEEDDDLPMAFVAPGGADGSIARLAEELSRSFNSQQAIQKFSLSPAGLQTLSTLDPQSYGMIVGKARMLEQPKVGAQLASFMKSQGGVTCAHLAAGVKAVSSVSRVGLVKAVAPECSDRQANAGLVAEELSTFDAMMCEAALSAK